MTVRNGGIAAILGLVAAALLASSALAGGGPEPGAGGPGPAPTPRPGQAGSAPVASVTLAAPLLGANEVPAPGPASAAGLAQISVNAGTGLVCGTLWIAGIEPTAAHIHRGGRSVNGPVVVDLGVAPSFPGALSRGTCRTAEPALVRELLESPTDFYVNVHTAEFPGGAIRGQLGRNLWVAQMSGDQEVPVRGPAAASGVTWAAADTVQRAICYVVEGYNMGAPRATSNAHIHRGGAGAAGPVVVDMPGIRGITGQPPAATGAQLTAFGVGCATDIEVGLLGAIIADLPNYYVNIHTDEFPGGAIRGQLSRHQQ